MLSLHVLNFLGFGLTALGLGWKLSRAAIIPDSIARSPNLKHDLHSSTASMEMFGPRLGA